MTTLRASAEVECVGCSGCTGICSHQSLWELFRCDSSPDRSREDAPPPRKRQRLDSGAVAATDKGSLDFGFDDAVTLARIELDLISPGLNPSEQSPETSATTSTQPCPVVIHNLERVSPQRFCISILGPRPSAAPLKLHVSSASTDDIGLHLERTLWLSPSRFGTVGSDTVAWTHCLLRAPDGDRTSFRLQVSLVWRLEASVIGMKRSKTYVDKHLLLLKAYLPDKRVAAHDPWSLQDFYENVHVPSQDLQTAPQIQSDKLECKLYPFQTRAVDWLLGREGVHFQNGALVSHHSEFSHEASLPPDFVAADDAEGGRCYVSHLRGTVVRDTSSLFHSSVVLRGGILAEEMGLGKTVELIALISLNQRTIQSSYIFDDYSGTRLMPSGATLIITPQSILEQWKSEINNHAPHLKVLHYKGLASEGKRGKDKHASVKNLLKYDVVLTTYSVLSREIHYANKAPERNMRHERKYARPRSPLVQISWWRVCLDEAQMIESGVSQAATVARLIPRVNAWAVSGTPLKKDVQDLLGLLVFLRYEPYCSSKLLWSRISKGIFKEIFGQIAMRHTKDKIRHELRLPHQRRVVITVPFTPVEEQNYNHLFQQMCDDCGLSADGAPIREDFDPNSPVVVDRMRQWLRRLRQTCLHPQVGGRNRRALGRGNGPLRTVGEVLEVMIEQNETELRAQQRQHILAQVLHGHILAYNKSDEHRSEKGLDIYMQALRQASAFVEECRADLVQERAKASAASEVSVQPEASSADDDETDVEGNSADKTGRIVALRKALRSALEVQHVCMFFVASAYYQIKTNEQLTVPDSEDFHSLEKLETEFYEKAKAIRKEMLTETHHKAASRMRKIAKTSKTRSFTKTTKVPTLTDLGGIENRKILEKMDNLGPALNKQAAQLEEWRQKVMDLLLLPLLDEDEGRDTTGDEYEHSTKIQDELYVCIAALRAIVADRRRALTGEFNFLIEQEVKEAVRQAEREEGHAPPLVIQTMQTRSALNRDLEDMSLRGVVSEVRSLTTSLQWQRDGGNDRANAELLILERELKEIQQISAHQLKALALLEREMELFRTTMNQRLDFYRQLQQISDTVAPYKEELDEELDEAALRQQEEKERITANRVATLNTKHRFLLHLRNESDDQGNSRMCIICQSPFEIGVLTVCGHQYCKECIGLWWREHRTCPICKRRLHRNDFHDITYKPQEFRAQEEQQEPPTPEKSTSSSPQASIYSSIQTSIMDEIKSIDLDGSYGTKIDTIARHLLWIRENDPGSKSIIFSQYPDFLDVLEGAFRLFKIGFASIGGKNGIEKFKRDPSVECFLLDAKTDSSGLNLVNATYVFLCEPLINAAIELQAIARVHRIGQQRPTTVFMYLISDTVEEAIYEISVSRRLAHISRRDGYGESSSRSGTATPMLQESAIDAANSLEMQKAPISKLLTKDKVGGEVVKTEDLWNCLFSKPRRHQSGVSNELQMEVDRHLRAEAAEQRRVAPV